jgi:hypothetical protein
MIMLLLQQLCTMASIGTAVYSRFERLVILFDQ